MFFAAYCFYEKYFNEKLERERRDFCKERYIERAPLNFSGLPQRDFTGRITHLTDDFGLFERFIYFERNEAMRAADIKVGTKVVVTALCDDYFENCQFVRMRLLHDDEEIGMTTENIITCVDRIEDKGLIIRLTNGQIVDSKNVDPAHELMPGDWVRVSSSGKTEDFATDRKVSHVEALRVIDCDSIVTETQRRGFITKNQVFIPEEIVRQSDCELTIGTRVRMTCIESKSHPRCNWRATRLEKMPESLESEDSFVRTVNTSLSETFLTDLGVRIEPTSMVFSETEVGTSKSLYFTISAEKEDTKLIELNLVSIGTPYNLFIDEQLIEDCSFPFTVSAIKPLFVKVVLKSEDVGRNETFCKFCFESGTALRKISSTVFAPDELMYDARSILTGPKQRNRATVNPADRSRNASNFVPGVKPVYSTKAVTPTRLPQYPVPEKIRSAILMNRDLTVVCPELLMPLNAKNYQTKFHTLLFIEEVQSDLEMAVFDMKNVQMRPDNEYLCMEVPGLAEGRPSLLVGDRILVKQANDLAGFSSPCNEAYIHKVTADTIYLRFNEAFHQTYDDYGVDVQFLPNRNSFKKAHQAVDFSSNFPTWLLFPQWLEVKNPLYSPSAKNRPSRPLKPSKAAFGYGYQVDVPFAAPVLPLKQSGVASNKDQNSSRVYKKAEPLALNPFESPRQSREFINPNLNERQQAAVRRILAGECRPIPYILFGPPGTGKTMTVVESILQVFVCIPESRILACAPSNSAADLIVQRLDASGVVSMDDVVRFNAANRSQNSIPDDILKYSCNDMDELETVARFRIAVCTCTTAGNFFTLELRPNHFTHVFVDEAGQATEPETMVALVLTAGNPEAMVILAGDPMQLGPVLRSTIAEEYGLGESFLARLSSRKLYARDESVFATEGNYNPKVMTKLVDNYRSHSALLVMPSKIFYNDELVPKADPELVNTFVDWQHLPNKEMPLIFCGVRGTDMRENDSPSWFNAAEIVLVAKYVKLISDDKVVASNEIGIITPYRKQVEKLRQFLASFEIGRMKIGSVEEFQGQERQVIILSTVRSDETKVESDVFHNIGFLANPRRFNVAITRSQALLVVVGNPFVLIQDKYWKTFIEYAVMNGCYIGCEPPQFIVESRDDYVRSGTLDRSNASEHSQPVSDKIGSSKISNVNELVQPSVEEPSRKNLSNATSNHQDLTVNNINEQDIEASENEVLVYLQSEQEPTSENRVETFEKVPQGELDYQMTLKLHEGSSSLESEASVSINFVDPNEATESNEEKQNAPKVFAEEILDYQPSESPADAPNFETKSETLKEQETDCNESTLAPSREFFSQSTESKNRPSAAESSATLIEDEGNEGSTSFSTFLSSDSKFPLSSREAPSMQPVWRLSGEVTESSVEQLYPEIYDSGKLDETKENSEESNKVLDNLNVDAGTISEPSTKLSDLDDESRLTSKNSGSNSTETDDNSFQLAEYHRPHAEEGNAPIDNLSTSTRMEEMIAESPAEVYSDLRSSVGSLSEGITIDSELSSRPESSQSYASRKDHMVVSSPREVQEVSKSSSKSKDILLKARTDVYDSEVWGSVEPYPEDLEPSRGPEDIDCDHVETKISSQDDGDDIPQGKSDDVNGDPNNMIRSQFYEVKYKVQYEKQRDSIVASAQISDIEQSEIDFDEQNESDALKGQNRDCLICTRVGKQIVDETEQIDSNVVSDVQQQTNPVVETPPDSDDSCVHDEKLDDCSICNVVAKKMKQEKKVRISEDRNESVPITSPDSFSYASNFVCPFCRQLIVEDYSIYSNSEKLAREAFKTHVQQCQKREKSTDRQSSKVLESSGVTDHRGSMSTMSAVLHLQDAKAIKDKQSVKPGASESTEYSIFGEYSTIYGSSIPSYINRIQSSMTKQPQPPLERKISEISLEASEGATRKTEVKPSFENEAVPVVTTNSPVERFRPLGKLISSGNMTLCRSGPSNVTPLDTSSSYSNEIQKTLDELELEGTESLHASKASEKRADSTEVRTEGKVDFSTLPTSISDLKTPNVISKEAYNLTSSVEIPSTGRVTKELSENVDEVNKEPDDRKFVSANANRVQIGEPAAQERQKKVSTSANDIPDIYEPLLSEKQAGSNDHSQMTEYETPEVSGNIQAEAEQEVKVVAYQRTSDTNLKTMPFVIKHPDNAAELKIDSERTKVVGSSDISISSDELLNINSPKKLSPGGNDSSNIDISVVQSGMTSGGNSNDRSSIETRQDLVNSANLLEQDGGVNEQDGFETLDNAVIPEAEISEAGNAEPGAAPTFSSSESENQPGLKFFNRGELPTLQSAKSSELVDLKPYEGVQVHQSVLELSSSDATQEQLWIPTGAPVGSAEYLEAGPKKPFDQENAASFSKLTGETLNNSLLLPPSSPQPGSPTNATPRRPRNPSPPQSTAASVQHFITPATTHESQTAAASSTSMQPLIGSASIDPTYNGSDVGVVSARVEYPTQNDLMYPEKSQQTSHTEPQVYQDYLNTPPRSPQGVRSDDIDRASLEAPTFSGHVNSYVSADFDVFNPVRSESSFQTSASSQDLSEEIKARETPSFVTSENENIKTESNARGAEIKPNEVQNDEKRKEPRGRKRRRRRHTSSGR